MRTVTNWLRQPALYGLLALTALLCMFPFYWIDCISFGTSLRTADRQWVIGKSRLMGVLAKIKLLQPDTVFQEVK